MALTDFNIDTSGTPEDVQRRQKLAEALMQQGMDTSPAAGGKGGGWMTAFNRGLAGALGGYQQGQAREEDRTNRAQANAQLVALLGGGGMQPQAPMGSVAAPAAPMPRRPARIASIDPNDAPDEAAKPSAPVPPPGVDSGLPTFGPDGKMMGNLSGNIGQPPLNPNAAVANRFPASPAMAAYVTNPYGNKAVQSALLTKALTPRDHFTDQKDADGNWYQVNDLTGQKTMIKGAEASPGGVREYEYARDQAKAAGQPFMDYPTWSDKKARAAATNVTTNVDTKGPDKYDTVMGEGLAKSHSALSNGVEDAQARARDLAAMQGAVDAIQKNGGTTGGMGQTQALEIGKTINAGAAALGLEPPINEKGIADKEFLTKFNRQIAGAQAKGAMGSRVTNFEMANYLKANPGLEMSITGNQRLIGIQSQIEQRNVAVGNAVREATAAAVGAGKRVNPAEIQAIIRKYDEEHHVMDPVTGQDLTQSYTLPEFQKGGNNPALSSDHGANLKKIRVWNPATGKVE